MDAGSLGELTDHRLIRMELVSTPAEVSRRRRRPETDRRSLRKMDPGRLEVSFLSSTWPERKPARTMEEEAEWLGDAMSRSSMPLCHPVARRAVYWWSQEIAEL